MVLDGGNLLTILPGGRMPHFAEAKLAAARGRAPETKRMQYGALMVDPK